MTCLSLSLMRIVFLCSQKYIYPIYITKKLKQFLLIYSFASIYLKNAWHFLMSDRCLKQKNDMNNCSQGMNSWKSEGTAKKMVGKIQLKEVLSKFCKVEFTNKSTVIVCFGKNGSLKQNTKIEHHLCFFCFFVFNFYLFPFPSYI